jgi:hypothetical protein
VSEREASAPADLPEGADTSGRDAEGQPVAEDVAAAAGIESASKPAEPVRRRGAVRLPDAPPHSARDGRRDVVEWPGRPSVRAVAFHGVVSSDLQVLREKLIYDTPFWARHCATILSEDRIAVPLIARPWQLRFDEALEAQRKAGLPMRAIILKARKLGFSTWVQAKFMQRVSQQPFQYALSIAHLRGAAGVLYDMASLMRERLPTDAQLGELIYGRPGRAAPFSVRPELVNKGESRNGARWMVLGDRMRKTEASIYETLTAGAKGGGRASTPSLVHGSEVAHFEDPGYLVGLLNAVPKRPETIVVLESTANGFNHFHDRWQRANEGAEDPETGGLYVPLFFGWQDNPLNAMPFPSPEARSRFEDTIGDPAGGGDPEEQWLVEAFGVTLEQLRWRRITRDEECGGDIEFFHQEHPATPEQAFIGSGNPVFAAILVSRALKQAEEARGAGGGRAGRGGLEDPPDP